MLKNFAGKLYYPQLFDRYLSDPDLAQSNYANVSQTSEENYTVRLGHILNAYFTSLNGFFAITAGINSDSAYFWDNNHTFTIPEARDSLWQDLYSSTMKRDKFKTKAWSSEATKTERTEVIMAHRGWIIALCITSNLLIVSSLVSPFVHHFLVTGVDVAMNLSSLATRNNSHIPLPSTGTFLHASDRARLLSKLKVRFGDADSSANIGSLAIGSLDRTEISGIARVRTRRFYE
jgi:hypothetical protein